MNASGMRQAAPHDELCVTRGKILFPVEDCLKSSTVDSEDVETRREEVVVKGIGPIQDDDPSFRVGRTPAHTATDFEI